MKYILFLLFILIAAPVTAQPGKPDSPAGRYAGSKKTMVGRMYNENMAELKNWKYLGGSVISPLSDPEWFLVSVFKKGTTHIIIFTIREDTAAEEEKIIDLVEVKNVLAGQEIKTGVCRENKTDNAAIVALIKPRNIEYNKAIKAWKLNRDKRRVEIMPVAKVDCMHEGF